MTEAGKREVARIAQLWEEETKNILGRGDKKCFIFTDFQDACENLLKTLPLVRGGCGQEVVRIND